MKGMKQSAILLAVAGFCLFGASSAFAYGAAGCGLGAELWAGQRGLISNLSANTTNDSSSKTEAMTSGTSGCDVTQSVELQQQQQIFIAQNYQRLSEEATQGSGEFLFAYAAVMGCQSAYPDFAQNLQSSYGDIFQGANDSQQIFSQTQRMIAHNPTLAKSCQL